MKIYFVAIFVFYLFFGKTLNGEGQKLELKLKSLLVLTINKKRTIVLKYEKQKMLTV